MVEPTETRLKSEESKEKKFLPKFNKRRMGERSIQEGS